jgi:hypothetical protein
MATGQVIDERIRAYMAKHGCGYVQAFREVTRDEAGDELNAYKSGDARYLEADQIRSLEAQVQNLAGRTLDVLTRARRRQMKEDYREAFREVALRNDDLARAYGMKLDPVPVERPRSWQR